MVMGGKIIYGVPFQPAPSILRGAFKLTISYRHWYFRVEMQDPCAGVTEIWVSRKIAYPCTYISGNIGIPP